MSYAPPSSAKPFTLHVPDSDLSSWRQLLELTPLGPKTYENTQAKRNFGRDQEKHINSYPNYKMKVEDIDLHFIALFSQKKDAVPIIFMHGWPGSFIEFLPLCDLVKKQYEGKDLPYHIIVPSLPGYTLSSGGPPDRDWTTRDSARILNGLMKNLGFNRYLAQGGDVGSDVGTTLATTYDECVGVHLNMLLSREPPDRSTLSALEISALDRSLEWIKTGTAYAQEHATRPSTIGHVLSSNPLALLAWIGEKFIDWTDTTPPLDSILTDVSLYWFTQGFPRSLYPYRTLLSGDRLAKPFIEKPTGFSFFPKELFPGLKPMVEKQANLVTYVKHERGGHFAALGQPKELWGDVEEYVNKAWSAKQ
ncbi:epoxide hydrolase-like protein [Byssothecium circinans]|uniref:Epoxide hydrolase-like protein n=1 Tax=Byssothecium circinans TaxID=147558 RepID=A0A6A5TPY7_9PLEO|nr:epoxide hydrolase-like protein [Byssothecium circinans]